jgi:beta-glucanase (GH16 family)
LKRFFQEEEKVNKMKPSAVKPNVFVLLFVCLTLVFSSSLYAQTLVWSDEFDGPGIDKNVWSYETGGSGFGNAELQCYTDRPDNAYIEDGKLVIQAKREDYGGKSFTSARLHTSGRLFFSFGIIEARIKIPDLREGLWPAFWMMGNNYNQVGWPACTETDILEMGSEAARLAGVTNRRVNSTAHWSYNGSYAGYGTSLDAASDLNDDYHIYKLRWTPSEVRTYLDDVQIWVMNLSGLDPNSLAAFHKPCYLTANLAVGGNFPKITSVGGITAPLPAKMYIDWIRLYDEGYTVLTKASDIAETGNFGLYTETTPVNDSVAFGVQEDLFTWNNMTPTTTTPYEGSLAWSFDIANGAWFGMGVFDRINRNMQNYSDGKLHFQMKTTTTMPISVGISSVTGEGWANDLDMYGLVRDGAWHSVVIPLNRIGGGVDFHTIKQIFMLKGGNATSSFNISLDDVYWEPDVVRPAPQNGNYGVYTENASNKTAGSYTLGTEGDYYIWSNTLVPATQHPYEGSSCLSYTSGPSLTWFGAAYTPFVKINLTAFRFPESKLHFAMKTTSTVAFQIGMKSGNITDIGQKWINFQNGSDPYGFARDGLWHVIEIPMTDITDVVDLSEVSQLFELLGTAGAISDIEIDDICFLNGGDAIPQGSSGKTVPTVSITAPTNGATFSPGSDIVVDANALDNDANIVQVEFFAGINSLGTDTTSPYSITWHNVPAGAYVLTARATADNDANRLSSPVAIYLGPEDLNGDGTVDTADLVILADNWLRNDCGIENSNCSGADYQPDGSVDMEDFYQFSLFWLSHANNPPTVSITSPIDGTTVTAPAIVTINATAADSDGTISKVDFYRGATLLGTDTSAPYSYAWTSVAGSHSITAVATDNGGAVTTSEAVGITVNPAPNVPPTVSITSPTNGATFAAPASITINASAADSDGTVTQVEFYQGTTLLYTDTSAPYSYTWTGVPVGSYSLTAKATDNSGAVTTSTAVGITVNLALLSQGKPATASSTQTFYIAANAVDGNMGTRWASDGNSSPQWIYVDLGATYTITQIILEWEAAYASSYQIQTSPDASTWTTIYSTTTGNGGNDTFAVSGSGRYVRMYGTVRGSSFGYSVLEFKVYGN